MNILVIKPSSLGDIVHALQVVESIRSELEDVHIDWVCREIFVPFVRESKTVENVYEFQRKGGITGFWKLLQEIRQKEYDFVLDMQGLLRSGLMTFAAKSKRKVGRKDAREGAILFYKEAVGEIASEPRHALDILLEFKKPFGLEPYLSSDLEFYSNEQLSYPEGFKVLMFPESRRPEKEWKSFPALTRRLITENEGISVTWAGAREANEPFLFESKQFVNRMGQSSVNEMPAMIAGADLIVANDSGPMHLAAAMGKQVVALFGPTDPVRFGPYTGSGGACKVVQSGTSYVEDITVDEVLYSVLKFKGLEI